jgi:hypothetical protein
MAASKLRRMANYAACRLKASGRRLSSYRRPLSLSMRVPGRALVGWEGATRPLMASGRRQRRAAAAGGAKQRAENSSLGPFLCDLALGPRRGKQAPMPRSKLSGHIVGTVNAANVSTFPNMVCFLAPPPRLDARLGPGAASYPNIWPPGTALGAVRPVCPGSIS